VATQTFSNFSSDSQTYIAAKTLMRIKRDVIVYGMGKHEKLPNKFSKTFQFTRYEKLVLPQVTLTEGVTPTSTSITLSTVSAVMDQWGAYVDISDVADITIKHPIMEQAITLLGEQAAETIDRECIKVLLANTNVYYAGVATSRATLGTTDYITSGLVKTAVAFLRKGGAHPNEGGRTFMGLIDPDVEMDLLEDDTFVLAASYSNIVALQNGEAGKWMGCRWMVSNLLPTMTNIPSANVTTASSATAGSLTASTNYFVVVTAVDNSLGYEQQATAVITQATAGGQTSLNVTAPVTTGFTYNIYLGSSATVTPLAISGVAPGVVTNLGSIGVGAQSPANTNTGVTSHYAWIMGKEAFAVPELMSLQTFLTPKQASDSDPILQRRRASWKVMFKAVICNQAFLARLEMVSRYN
jgi:N4-gp56 family major capsid protein